MTDDDFRNAPISIAEHRAKSANRGSLWTPRDALVSLLRRIDSGDVKPLSMVICFEVPGTDDHTSNYETVIASPERDKSIALWYRGLHGEFHD